MKRLLLNKDMVPKVVDGTVTQFSRPMKPQPAWETGKPTRIELIDGLWRFFVDDRICITPYWKSPHKVGDILWLAEGFCIYTPLKKCPSSFMDGGQENVIYRASHKLSDMEGSEDICFDQDISWKSPATMPQWAARKFYKVTSVKARQLGDMTEAECEAEGIEWLRNIPDCDETLTARQLHEVIWDSTHPKYPASENPHIFTYTIELTGRDGE